MMEHELYELYHKNTGNLLHPIFFKGDSRKYRPEYKSYRRAETIENPIDEYTGINGELRERRSFDEPTGGPVSRRQVFNVLASSYGLSRPEEEARPVPSGGARYPLELYVLVRDGQDIDEGVYHYNVRDDSLERLCGLPDRFLERSWYQIGDTDHVSAMLIVTADVERSSTKYGERGYMFACMETGSVLQNVQLAGQGCGLRTRPYAGFNQTAVAELLDLRDEYVMLSIAMVADD